MKIAYSQLKQLIPALPAPAELEPILAQMGLPLEDLVEVPAPPSGVILVSVESVSAIPDTKLTKITFKTGKYADGQHGSKTIASGAPNAAHLQVGQMLTLITPNTTVGELTYGVRQMQGVESWGMAASYKELGLGESNAGVTVLPVNTAEAGTPLSELWPADWLLDVEVTPNRADVLSVLGLARDLAAFLQLELVESPISSEISSSQLGQTVGQIQVSLPENGVRLERDPAQILRFGCDHFAAKAVSQVTNGPAPLWLQRRLCLAGMRCIDLIVDVSNYVMLELGQPTALYDRRDIANDHILVTFGLRQGETLPDLLGNTHTVGAEDLLILDGQPNQIPSVEKSFEQQGQALPANGALGIAGVVGAKHGQVRHDTSEVVIESAHFDPVLLRRTSTRLGLKTDAVYRFERGVDPLLAPKAAQRVAELLAEYGGAQPEEGLTLVGQPALLQPITVSGEQIRQLLGMQVATSEMVEILQRLGCDVTLADDQLTVTPPSWRIDLQIWQDLAEEVARLHGFVHLPETLPTVRVDSSNIGASLASQQHDQLRYTLAGMGFQEVVTYTFTSNEEAAKARSAIPNVRLQNPMTNERTGMRTSLYPSLLKSAQQYAKGDRVMLFEIGRIFPESGECQRLGLLMRGDFSPKSYQAGIAGSFSLFKGVLEALSSKLGADLQVRQQRGDEVAAALHPGIAGSVIWNGQDSGFIGALHPEIAAEFGLKGDTFLVELALPLPATAWAFSDPSRAPAAWRDLAIIAPKEVSYGEIAALLQKVGGSLLESLQPFDIYTGEQLAEGQRSVAVRMIYRSHKTLTESELDPVFAAQMQAVKQAGWTVRDGLESTGTRQGDSGKIQVC